MTSLPKPPIRNLLIRQGSTEVFDFITTDSTGAAITATAMRLQARTSAEAVGTELDLTEADPQVTITAGLIQVTLTETTTAALTATTPDAPLVYDMEFQYGTRWYRPVQGAISVDRNITR